jgi:hypothetical protein
MWVFCLKVTITQDDGIRPGTTAASLSSLRTVFKKDGTTTAGNSSQVGARYRKVTQCPGMSSSMLFTCLGAFLSAVQLRVLLTAIAFPAPEHSPDENCALGS